MVSETGAGPQALCWETAHLPKVPALAVDVDLAAVDAMGLRCQLGQSGLDLAHGAEHEVAHDVEAEPVYLRRSSVSSPVAGIASISESVPRSSHLPEQMGILKHGAGHEVAHDVKAEPIYLHRSSVNREKTVRDHGPAC